MKLSFYDPQPYRNDYLSIVYLKELRKYCVDKGILIEDIEDPLAVRNATILLNANWLEAGVITRLKENGNKIISFDINDNTYFTDCVPEDELLEIDRIFKVSGIQLTGESNELFVDNDLNYRMEKIKFRGGSWGKYFEAVALDKVRPLPHPPWMPIISEHVSWQDRHKSVLLRGSHQYLRVLLFFQLIKKGLLALDGNSMFPASMYIHQFCDGCKAIFKQHGRITLGNMTDTPCRNNNWSEGGGQWNNSCIPRYLDMAVAVNAKNDGVPFDFNLIEKAFDGRWETDWLDRIANRYLFNADYKWIFSIYAPPRFWESAGAGTINLVSERINDQEHFPAMKDGEHYVTYKEDFSNLGAVSVSREEFEFITNNCLGLYNQWIKPELYKVSKNLLQHIIDNIENVGG
uniref:Uncharacterized protein n=1 Tax=viral metagenome TaxID=1070528 RepID=A0A6M3LAD1_9ZZZZ